jgi:pimeloyl-ACP methyl ester carboxylesterase
MRLVHASDARTEACVAAVTHGAVQADGHRLEYFEAGEGGQPTLLLIHGAGSSARIWDTVQQLLAEVGVHTIAFSTLGAGGSDRSERAEDYHPSAYARTLLAGLAERGIDRVVTVGHSLGNATASYVIKELGGRVLGHVNLAGVNPRNPGRRPGAAIPERARAGYGAAMSDEALARWREQHVGLSETTRDQLRADIDNNPEERRLGQAAPYPGIEEMAPNLEIPVLVVFGDSDDVLPPPVPLAYCDELPEAVRSLHVFYGVGHYPNAQVPDRLVGVLRRWLADRVS